MSDVEDVDVMLEGRFGTLPSRTDRDIADRAQVLDAGCDGVAEALQNGEGTPGIPGRGEEPLDATISPLWRRKSQK